MILFFIKKLSITVLSSRHYKYYPFLLSPMFMFTSTFRTTSRSDIKKLREITLPRFPKRLRAGPYYTRPLVQLKYAITYLTNAVLDS